MMDLQKIELAKARLEAAKNEVLEEGEFQIATLAALEAILDVVSEIREKQSTKRSGRC